MEKENRKQSGEHSRKPLPKFKALRNSHEMRLHTGGGAAGPIPVTDTCSHLQTRCWCSVVC